VDTNETATITNLTGTGVDCHPKLLNAVYTGGNDLQITAAPGSAKVLLGVQFNNWTPEPASYPVDNPTQVSPPGDRHTGQWCIGNPPSINWSTGVITNVPTFPDADGGGKENWCLVTQTSVMAGTANDGSPLMQVSEVWLLNDDALACRTCR
jgi:hypothetical protein